jgi:hypothetical protein
MTARTRACPARPGAEGAEPQRRATTVELALGASLEAAPACQCGAGSRPTTGQRARTDGPAPPSHSDPGPPAAPAGSKPGALPRSSAGRAPRAGARVRVPGSARVDTDAAEVTRPRRSGSGPVARPNLARGQRRAPPGRALPSPSTDPARRSRPPPRTGSRAAPDPRWRPDRAPVRRRTGKRADPVPGCARRSHSTRSSSGRVLSASGRVLVAAGGTASPWQAHAGAARSIARNARRRAVGLVATANGVAAGSIPAA